MPMIIAMAPTAIFTIACHNGSEPIDNAGIAPIMPITSTRIPTIINVTLLNIIKSFL